MYHKFLDILNIFLLKINDFLQSTKMYAKCAFFVQILGAISISKAKL